MLFVLNYNFVVNCLSKCVRKYTVIITNEDFYVFPVSVVAILNFTFPVTLFLNREGPKLVRHPHVFLPSITSSRHCTTDLLAFENGVRSCVVYEQSYMYFRFSDRHLAFPTSGHAGKTSQWSNWLSGPRKW